MSDNLYQTGIRPAVDEFLLKRGEERRDYGEFWSASSAGYCYKKNILERLKVPYSTDPTDLARTQRVFQSGDLFHEFYQKITKKAGLSIAQELEVIDEDLKIKGHIDDLVLVPNPITPELIKEELKDFEVRDVKVTPKQRLILMDYKTRNSRSFRFAKEPMKTHEMQVGTYMYVLKTMILLGADFIEGISDKAILTLKNTSLKEARVLNVEKDTLRQAEVQYLYTDELEKKIVDYWTGLNEAWDKFNKDGLLPECTCQSFMATERYNPFFYDGKPCSTAWLKKSMKEAKK